MAKWLMPATRIPPIQCLLTFEALARLRSVTQASEELFVTPSALEFDTKTRFSWFLNPRT